MTRKIEIVEVGPRDGLQNDPVLMPTDVKIEFVERLIDAGVKRMEAASFVCFAAMYGSMSAKWTSSNQVLAYRMEIFSASLSIGVGSLWLILLYFGILDEIFP